MYLQKYMDVCSIYKPINYRKSGIFHLFSKYIKEKFTIGNIHILLA